MVCFDKTGTLTTGKLVVTDIVPTTNHTEDAVLFYAACAETGSEHSIAKAVLNHAKQTLPSPEFESIHQAHDTVVIPGRGVQSTYQGKKILVGNLEFMNENHVEVGKMASDVNEFRHNGKTVLFVGLDETFIGCLAVHDELRTNAVEVIQELHHQGNTILLPSFHSLPLARI